MRRDLGSVLAACVLLAACEAPVDTSLISREPARPLEFARAQTVAQVCAENLPDTNQVSLKLGEFGYEATGSDTQATYYMRPGSEVIAVVGERRSHSLCVIGLPGLTPTQSVALAQIWVDHFGAITNAERGQGLSNKAVEAWGSLNEERIAYIAAYWTWPFKTEAFPDVPGSAVSLIVIPR